MAHHRIKSLEFVQKPEGYLRFKKEGSFSKSSLEQLKPISVTQRDLHGKPNTGGITENLPLFDKGSSAYINRLEGIIAQKNEDIEKLQHLNIFLEQGVKKREEIARVYFEENTKLKETLRVKEKQIQVFKQKLEKARHENTLLTEGIHNPYRLNK